MIYGEEYTTIEVPAIHFETYTNVCVYLVATLHAIRSVIAKDVA